MENNINNQLCIFQQMSYLITHIITSFAETIKNLIEKFEASNINKLRKLETQIFTVNERADFLEEKLGKLQEEIQS